MVDEVRREIERIRGHISNGRLTQFDEANTKAIAIEPILRELGWDVVDPDEVTREYSVGSRSVDYALFYDNNSKVFVEAKRGNEPLERHQEQLVRYAFDEGVEIAILTNGATWWFYLPIRAVNWERRKVATVELNQRDSAETAQEFVDVLSKENVCSGKAIRNAERHQVMEALPDVWNRLVSEPSSPLVNLLAERTHRLCVREPDRDEVEQFLSGHREQIQITSHSTAPEPNLPSEPEAILEPEHSDSKREILTAFTFNGRRYEISSKGRKYKDSSWREMIVKLCEIVHRAHSNQFDEVLNLRGPSERIYFSKNSKHRSEFRNPQEISGTDIYVTATGLPSAKRIAETLITNFGYNKGDLSFDFQRMSMTPPPAAREATVAPEPNLQPNPLGRSERTTCKAFTFCGNRHEVSSWRDMIVKLCEIVHRDQRDRFDEILNLRGTQGRVYFSRDSSELRVPKRISGTDIFITDTSPETIKQIAKRLITNFGYDESDLSYETRTL